VKVKDKKASMEGKVRGKREGKGGLRKPHIENL
jgi:hypothetical protein